MSPSRLFTGFKRLPYRIDIQNYFLDCVQTITNYASYEKRGVKSSKWTLTKPNQSRTQGRPLNCIFSHYWRGRQLNFNISKILYFLFSLQGLLKPCASASPVSSLSWPGAAVLPTLRGVCPVSLLPTFLQVCHEVYALLQALNSLLKIFSNILIVYLSFICKVTHFPSYEFTLILSLISEEKQLNVTLPTEQNSQEPGQ